MCTYWFLLELIDRKHYYREASCNSQSNLPHIRPFFHHFKIVECQKPLLKNYHSWKTRTDHVALLDTILIPVSVETLMSWSLIFHIDIIIIFDICRRSCLSMFPIGIIWFLIFGDFFIIISFRTVLVRYALPSSAELKQ